MVLNLYTAAGDFRAFRAQITAQYNDIQLGKPAFEQGKDEVKSVDGRVPALETRFGIISEPNAIARYVAKLRADTELLGKSFFETAQVDQWLDFAAQEIDTAVAQWVYPVLGFAQYDANVYKAAVSNLNKALGVLNNHLLLKTYLVGESITLADIAIVSALYYAFKFVLDEKARAQYPNVVRWFVTCANQAAFKAVLGDVVFATEELKAGKVKAEKKTEKKAEKKTEKKAEKTEKAAPAAPAKPKDLFEDLPPTPLNIEEWKRVYSNSREDYYASMDWFWQNYDNEGWTIWKAEYNYNSDNTVDWQTSNLVAGFVQRSESVRKHGFGVMAILGAEAPFAISGAWLIRGKSIEPMLQNNPDAEYYTWTPIDPNNEEDRKFVADHWCALEKIGDQVLYDSKILK